MPEQDQDQNSSAKSTFGEIVGQLPLDELKNQLGDFATAAGERAISSFSDRIDGLIGRLNSVASGDGDGGGGGALSAAATKGAEKLAQGDSPVKAGLSGLMSGATESVKQVFGGGGGGGAGGKKKFSNIVETIEVGVPVRVAYNQWTQFEDWTGFMKKLEHSEEQTDEKLSFKGQIFLSHRSWQSTVIQQVPDEQIVWKSTGEKGYLDGGVTFHEITPRLTRIVVVIEYHPQGFVEKTGNIWRAAGRRIRVELKRYVNHVMTSTILDPDSVEGWRGEIRDSEVVRTHEEALEAEQEEQAQQDEAQDQEQPQGELEQGKTQDQDQAQGGSEQGEAQNQSEQGEAQDESEQGETPDEDQDQSQGEPEQGEAQDSSQPESDASESGSEEAQASESEGDAGSGEEQPSADSENQTDDNEQEEASADTDQPAQDQSSDSGTDSSDAESSSDDGDDQQQSEADQSEQEEPPAQPEND